MENFLVGLAIVVGTIVIIAVIVALPTMWLWNWLMPVIFGIKQITFLQALGINLLTGILFGSRTSSGKSK